VTFKITKGDDNGREKVAFLTINSLVPFDRPHNISY